MVLEKDDGSVRLQCDKCGEVIEGFGHSCKPRVLVDPKFMEEMKNWVCDKCNRPIKNPETHDCQGPLHHVRATIKVGVSVSEEALQVFKQVSAIFDVTGFEARRRVLKALNEIYLDEK